MLGFLLFWRRSRAMSVLDDVMLFMFLIDVASVSQLCSPLYYSYYMGCCEDYLTCDIAFNAVMPLSRASTRGSYSRIEGVKPNSLVKAFYCQGVVNRCSSRRTHYKKYVNL